MTFDTFYFVSWFSGTKARKLDQKAYEVFSASKVSILDLYMWIHGLGQLARPIGKFHNFTW